MRNRPLKHLFIPWRKCLFFISVVSILLNNTVLANITVSTTTNGDTQVNGYFNETNSITITVTLDNTGNADYDTFKNGAIYLQLAWAENGNVPTTFNDFAETGQSSFGGTVSAEINVTNSNLANTNGTPDQDNFALKVVVMNKTLNPDTTTTKDITFEGSNSYIKYDVTDAYLTSYSYPGSNFNTQKVVYSLSENLADAFSSTVEFTGTSGTDNGTIHSYTLGSQAADEKQTGGTRTVTLSGQLSNGDLVHDNYYSLTFTLRDAAGNSRTTTYTNLYYDTQSATVTGVTSSKSSGTYGIGEDIPFTVSFSEAVTTSGGNISLSFNSGATETITISNSTEGSGTYTVSEGESTSGSALSVTSPLTSTGSVKDAAGNAMSGSDFDIPNGQNINNSKTIIIDGVRPTISGLTSSSPSASYSTGEDIDVTITFSEAVTLSSGSNLIITLETGSTDRTVTIAAADIVNTNSVSGTYTVQDGDESADLAAISVTLDGGSLTDGAGNAMTDFNIPSNQNISDSKDIVVETTAPTISQVSSTTSDGTYGIDDDVNITITFSEAVTLSGGNLVITLETGDTDQQVIISSINNSTTASGTYTVQEDDQSSDLTVTDISLSAGTITDNAGNTMSDFTIPGAANLDDLKDIIIEATRPTVSSVSSTTSDGTYGIGDNINISVTFSEAVNLTTGSLVITLDNNQTVSISSISSDLTVSGTYTVQEGDESSDLDVQNITVSGGTLTDDAGNAMKVFTIPSGQNLADAKALVIDGVRPTVDNISSTTDNGNYKIGDDVNLTVTFSEAVSLVGGDLVIELETGTTDRTVSISPFTSATTASGTYTVQEGDSNDDLTVNQVYLTAGNIVDAAGNAMSSFSIPTGSNLDDQKNIVVDGIYPSDFQVGNITAAGGTVVADYWNSTNTSLEVTVPLETTDTSLVDGTVQLQAKIGANTYADLGASTALVQSDVTSGSKTITVQASGTADTDFEEITGFEEGTVVTIRAILTDASGNSKTGTASSTTITIDQTAASVQSISSSSANTTYKIGDDVNIKVTFSDAVTLTSGNLLITLETGDSDRTLSVSSVSNTTTVSTTYTVESGEKSSDLTVKSLTVSGGSLIDVAGNPATELSIPSGSNLGDANEIVIDGVVPSDFTVGSVTSLGGTEQPGYWNGTNTSVSIITPIANDTSLVDGTIQLRASVDGGSYENLGSAETIALSDLSGDKTISIAEADFESLTDFTDGSVITITAIITDAAGNSTTGSPSATTLIVDQTEPANFTVGDVTPLGNPVVSGYWNGTNTGARVRVPLASDATLVNGQVRLQAKAGSGGSWQSIGSLVTVKDSDLSSGYIDVTADSGGTDSLDIRELTGFGDGYRLYFRAILHDAAGNQTTGSESDSTLLIDETVPSISNITSSSQDGLYKAGDTVNVTVNFTENVSLDIGSVDVLLNVAQTISNTSVSGTDQISFDYIVQENDETGELTVNTVSVSGGSLSDIAGNVVNDYSIPGNSNLSDNSAIQIDGVYPTDFAVGEIKTVGGSVVDGYWNSTNTALEVAVPIDNDASLVDGELQLRTSVDGGSFQDLDSPVTLENSDLASDKTLTISASVFEGISGFADDVEITITAIITDKAGNSTTGTAGATTIKVDQTAPEADTVGVVTTSGGNIVSSFWNGTNSGVVVRVPLDQNDGSLSGGTVRLQAKAGITSSFENIAVKESIQDADIIAGFIDVTADSGGTDSVDVREISGFGNNKLLYFRAVVEDVAGNSVTHTQSDSTLLVDEISPYVLSVQSPDADIAYNAGDTITIQVLINENITLDIPGNPPYITMDIGGSGASASYISGSGTDTLIFRYIVAENHSSDDLDYVSTSPLQLYGADIRDLAGNEFIPTLPTPGTAGSLSDNNDIVIDTEAPTAAITLSDSLVNRDDTPLVTVTFSEQIVASPQIYVAFAGGSTLDTTDMFQVDSVTWTYSLTIPDSNDGAAAISIIGTDLAGNAITEDNTSGRFKLTLDNTPPADFTTGTVLPNGDNPVPGWINAATEEIQITVPVVSPETDPSLYGGGSVTIQMYNMARGTDWVTIGTADSIQNFGDITFRRSIDEITSQLVPGSSLIVGDSLLTRAIITDRVGNRTIGDSSASVLTYDPNPLQPGTITGGTVLTSDTLISTDIITMEWSGFNEQDPAKESGLDYYEIAVEQIGDDSINAFVDWLDIGKKENHTFNLPLEHMKQYRLHLRGIDIAGNISDTLASDTLLRLNSAPQIVAIDSLNLFEDLSFADSILVVDPDTDTQLGDEFRYYVQTTRIIGEPKLDSMRVDSLTGAMTWTPTQDDTGSYTIRIIVRDNWGFADTLETPLTVHAVNDTPVVQFLPPADHITFVEDHTDTVRIDLTPYASDVDNDSTELSWQVVILDTISHSGFPTGRVIVGPGTTAGMETYLRNLYSPKPVIGKNEKIDPATLFDIISETPGPKISVTIDTVGGSTYATFDSDSNYYGDNHRLIFYVSDPFGAVGKDTMLLTILPRNDPPVWSDIPLIEVLENDSVKIDFADFVVDVDDTLLTINVTPLTNGSYMTISPSNYQARTYGDTVLFEPRDLWSDSALIKVVATDEQGASDSTTFVIDVIRVPRPQLSVAVLQNNAFTNFFEIVITDTIRKVVDLTLKVQNQVVSLDTVADYTFVGLHNFISPGTYTFDVSAHGVVGDTSITRQVGMTLAKTTRSWYGSSPDGRFRVKGSSGAVSFDQPILVVDSTMFGDLFNDMASYRIGNENMRFRKPVEVSIQGLNDDVALYQRINGVTWKELPSMTVNGSVMSYTQKMGYFRLGPKTLIVPGVTSLHQNYPNPFNPVTNIIYDVGFIEGPRQKVNISVFNILGQHIRTLVNDYKEIGRYTVRWAGKDDNGVNIASGIYFIRLTTNQGKIQTRKVMLLR